MRHSNFPDPALDTACGAVYFDWALDLRSGGPPGYLANLSLGLDQLECGADIAVISREETDTTRSYPERMAHIPLFARETGGGAPQTAPDLGKMTAFLARPDLMEVRAADLARLRPQERSIIHVHTTVDAIKMHNTLTRIGQRHRIKLLLTSHCPESPAREWAAKAFADGADAQAAMRYYYAHLELDLQAFGVADVLVFPCADAMEPYRATLPEFDRLFAHRDVRFLPSGAQALDMPDGRGPLRAAFEIGDGFVASYLGRHNQVKGYDSLSRVGTDWLARQSDAHVLIGGRPGPLPTPDHPRWHELGWTDRPGDVLAAADCFVLPNQQTYFDLMMLEVLSAGVPVIAARTGGNRFFEGLSSGIDLYSGEQDLARALDAMRARTADERAAMGAANRALFEAEFTPVAFAKRYAVLLEEVTDTYRLNRPAAPRLATPRHAPLPSVARPRISVIVPVYNVETFLPACLSSIAAQSEGDIEVLVVNDGATDGCPGIIDAQCERDPRFRRIDRPNGGLSAARNTGLDAARGDWIAFVDSDDVLDENMLRDLVTTAEAEGASVAICGVGHIDEAGAMTSEASSFLDDNAIYPQLRGNRLTLTPQVLSSLYPSAWNKLYKADLFEGLRYDAGLLFEDHPVFYKALAPLDHVAYVPDPLYLHRDHGAGRITRDASRRVLDVLVILDLIESRMRALVSDPQTCGRLMARLILRLVWERSFAVNDGALRFKLAEGAMMRFARWSLDQEAVRSLRDDRIPDAFVTELFRWADWYHGWSNPAKAAAIWSENLTVVDRTPASPTHPPDPGMVSFEPQDNFVLIHPQEGATTTAEVTGLGFFGPGNVGLSLCLEHSDANPIAFRVLLAPVSIQDPGCFDRADDPIWIARTDWQTADPMVPVPISLPVPDGSPTLALYVQSRVPAGGKPYFCWLRLRELRVTTGIAPP